VIDTVGVKTDRPFAMIDFVRYARNTKGPACVETLYVCSITKPQKGALGTRRQGAYAQSGTPQSQFITGTYLQIHLTVEDEGAFTTPWTGDHNVCAADPRPNGGKVVCAENRYEYYNRKESDVPRGGQSRISDRETNPEATRSTGLIFG